MSVTSNSATAFAQAAATWCSEQIEFAVILAEAFLVLAFLVALVETGLALWAKLQAARGAPAVVQDAIAAALPAVDPVKLLEALKGVLDALKGLPAWIAICLAGFALLWLAGQKPEYCGRIDSGQATENHGAPSASNSTRSPERPSNGSVTSTSNVAN